MNQSGTSSVAVFGGTGRQGGSVARYLRAHGGFRVRVISRDPSKARDIADEVVYGDLTNPETLDAALAGAEAVFLVTDYWAKASTEDWMNTPVDEWSDPVDEFAQGEAAVKAAQRAGVGHFIWSTLPDTHKISGGAYDIPYWTSKAKLDDFVSDAGFEHHTFVEAPFYYQNFWKEMEPQLQEDSTRAWHLPMRPDSKVMHMADIEQMGALVLGALLHPDKAGQGQHLSLCGGTYSWTDVVQIFKEHGQPVAYHQVEDEAFDKLLPGAKNVRHSLNYMERHTYFGPTADEKIALARAVATEPLASLDDWLHQNEVKWRQRT